jgi:hypothetical protein
MSRLVGRADGGFGRARAAAWVGGPAPLSYHSGSGSGGFHTDSRLDARHGRTCSKVDPEVCTRTGERFGETEVPRSVRRPNLFPSKHRPEPPIAARVLNERGPVLILKSPGRTGIGHDGDDRKVTGTPALGNNCHW